MATKPAEVETNDDAESGADDPLLDTVNAAIKKMVARGKERGYVTVDEISDALPQDEVSSEQIEDTMTMLSEMGINVIENEEAEEATSDEPAASGEAAPERPGTPATTTPTPTSEMRLYRRPGAHVSARDGPGGAAVARRRNRHCQADRGRAAIAMIGGICRKPADAACHRANGLQACCKEEQCAAARHHRPRRHL